jgi:hypothetical protein
VSQHAASLVKAALACAVVAAVPVAVPAWAQNTQNEYRPTGTRIISQTEAAGPDMGRRLLRLTSACVNRRYDSEVVSLPQGQQIDFIASALRDYAIDGLWARSEAMALAMGGVGQ